jgi:integration host factor subunit alpha
MIQPEADDTTSDFPKLMLDIANGATITRSHLAEAIHLELGLSRHDSSALLEQVLEYISASLEDGETVKISRFGTFSVRQKAQRIGRNPKTGVEVPILPRRVLIFRPSQVLKARINGLAFTDEDDAAE